MKEKETKEFDAYAYAGKFEELSLEVVLFREDIKIENVIGKDTTQETRDKGVDSYIILSVNNVYSTYTIEAKLRTSTTLSLSEFATSILYCLVNTSSKHFVVTNISFSNEAQKYIEQLNRKKEKVIELIDGNILKEIINSHISHFNNYPNELLNYILLKKITNSLTISCQHNINQFVNNRIDFPSFSKWINRAMTDIGIGVSLFLVKGYKGVGKRTWIDAFCEQKNIKQIYSVYTLDISKVQTPRLLIIDFLRFILGIDMESLFYDLSSQKNSFNNIFYKMQSFKGCTPQILNALRFLIESDSLKNEEYIYMMNILAEHLYKNFFVYSKLIIIIEKLHLSDSKMISFTINLINCMGSSNVKFILSILLTKQSHQLPFITEEQWWGYIHLLEGLRLNNTNTSKIELSNMTLNDTKEVIKNYLKGPVLTDEYYKEFVNHFGTNPDNVFNALKIIKNKKIYSTTLLKILNENPNYIESYILELLSPNYLYSDFFNEATVLIYLLEGNLEEWILDYLSEKYLVNSRILLFKEGFLSGSTQKNSISLQFLRTLKNIMPFISVQLKKKCANWLLSSTENLSFNNVIKEYFKIKFLYIVDPQEAIYKINNIIKSLLENQFYDYATNLAYIRCDYYKKESFSLLYYKYLVKYINYLEKYYTSKTEEIYDFINDAELIKGELQINHSKSEEFININLELALICYRIEKSKYNYTLCEKYINYILSYEDTISQTEPFALARIYYALNLKEQGLRNQFIIELVKALKKYPQNKDVKISYYANIAAMYKNHNISISIKLIRLVQKITYNEKKHHGDLWTSIDLLNYLSCLRQVDFSQIQAVRNHVEKTNSIANLARTYNVEAYYNLSHNNLLLAKECLETAIFHCLASGQNKQYFLFTLNLMNIKLVLREETEHDLYNAIEWFLRHQERIVERLHKNPYKETDHMYVALCSLIYTIKQIKKDVLLKNLNFQTTFPEIAVLSPKQVKNKICNFYINNNVIFILF